MEEYYAGQTDLRAAARSELEPGGTGKTASNWENDNIQPSIEMLVRLAKLFGVTTDYLLGLEDTPRISVEGLPETVVAHISLLIEDYRQK